MTVFPSNVISERATIRFERIEKRAIPYDMVNEPPSRARKHTSSLNRSLLECEVQIRKLSNNGMELVLLFSTARILLSRGETFQRFEAE